MFKVKVFKIWILAVLSALLVAGCGRERTPSPFPPTVIAVTPLNGAVNVALNSTVTATFSTVMAPASLNTTTFIVTGPGGAVAGSITVVGATATFTSTSTLPAETLLVATITTGATDAGGNALVSNFVWSFTTTAPAVLSTVPASAAMAVAVNTVVSATFNEAMNPATIGGATFTVKGPGATPVAGIVTYGGATATFTPTLVLAANTLFTATITTGAQDPAGNALAANYVWAFTTDVAPTVVSTVPANAAITVAVDTPITATFSRAMDPATITSGTFTVTGPGATPVAGAVTYAGTTATFTPTAILAANTLFTATITTGAKDPTGNALAANFVWTFTTDVAPTVVSSTPANAAPAVPLNTTVTATFSRAMEASTIDSTTFTLTGPAATAVAGEVSYSGLTGTFTPAAPLAGSTLYTATVTTGAQDPTGNALAANYVWTFTTAVQPAVTSANPANGATSVPLNQKITATFNQPMNAASITAAGTFTVAVTTGGAAVAGVVTYDAPSNTAVFTPTAALTASTQYTGTITTAAQTAAGSALAGNYVWNFTTGTAASATAPPVASTDPASAATLVPVNQDVAATFTRAMDPATISALGTVTVVVTAGAVPVSGTVTYDTASQTVVFTPAAALTAGTQYTATISAAAKDLEGNALTAGAVPNPWSFTTSALSNDVGPTITLASPANLATNVPINQSVSATFSAPMDPMTITNATFTVAVAGVGGAPVNGTVAYDVASQIATFTPSASLAPSTQYTATISNAATDLAGNPLIAGGTPNPWNFTTGTTVSAGQPPVNLGSASSFAIMATSSIASTGPGVVNGDVGLDPGTSQGIPPPQVNGTIHINDPIVAKAQSDLLAAYNDAVNRSTNSQTLPGNMGGLTFAPGLYTNSTSVLISGAGPNNNVTLDAQGDPNAVFIFQMGSTLTTAPGAQVILAGGAKAGNVFWQVGSSATIDTTTIFEGNVLAAVSITMNSGAVVQGRLFAGSGGQAASVTFDGASVTVPAP